MQRLAFPLTRLYKQKPVGLNILSISTSWIKMNRCSFTKVRWSRRDVTMPTPTYVSRYNGLKTTKIKKTNNEIYFIALFIPSKRLKLFII